MKPRGKDILARLIELYAEQEGVTIQCVIKQREEARNG
jgi:hypothetical protein